MRRVTQSSLGVPSPAPADAENHAHGEPDEDWTRFERPIASSQRLISRRAAIGGGLAGLGGLLLFPGQLLARKTVPSDPFVILLKGLYQPVIDGPNLGLSTVDLNDGSFSTTKIYPVSGTPGNTNQNQAIGDFYAQFTGDLCAYHIPGGSIAMRFTFVDDDYVLVDDGQGGSYLRGTLELTVIEATGIYRSFVGGHNHMVDNLHLLASGAADEYCFCNIRSQL